jgi:hypothetical protein
MELVEDLIHELPYFHKQFIKIGKTLRSIDSQ